MTTNSSLQGECGPQAAQPFLHLSPGHVLHLFPQIMLSTASIPIASLLEIHSILANKFRATEYQFTQFPGPMPPSFSPDLCQRGGCGPSVQVESHSLCLGPGSAGKPPHISRSLTDPSPTAWKEPPSHRSHCFTPCWLLEGAILPVPLLPHVHSL